MKLMHVPPKKCCHCKQLFFRKQFQSGTWESPKSFAARKYCGHRCMGEAKAVRSAKERMLARGRYQAQTTVKAICCEKCGTTTNLIRHHNDEDPTNNAKSNIQVLCRKCHNNLHKTLRTKKACRVCGKKHHSSGLCATHYHRFKQHGDPLKKCLNNRLGVAVYVGT